MFMQLMLLCVAAAPAKIVCMYKSVHVYNVVFNGDGSWWRAGERTINFALDTRFQIKYTFACGRAGMIIYIAPPNDLLFNCYESLSARIKNNPKQENLKRRRAGESMLENSLSGGKSAPRVKNWLVFSLRWFLLSNIFWNHCCSA
jgi:hypothetical protein